MIGSKKLNYANPRQVQTILNQLYDSRKVRILLHNSDRGQKKDVYCPRIYSYLKALSLAIQAKLYNIQ